MKVQNPLLWVDLEFTGFNPDRHSLLEVAFAFSDGPELLKRWRTKAPDDDTGYFTSLVACNNTHNVDWQQGALELHQKNGLLQLWQKQSHADCTPLHVIDSMIRDEAIYMFSDGYTFRKPHLAGSSVHWDRDFIRKYLPQVDIILHHRHMDVSSLISLDEMATGRNVRTSQSAHRSKDDMMLSFETFCAYHKTVKETFSR